MRLAPWRCRLPASWLPTLPRPMKPMRSSISENAHAQRGPALRLVARPGRRGNPPASWTAADCGHGRRGVGAAVARSGGFAAAGGCGTCGGGRRGRRRCGARAVRSLRAAAPFSAARNRRQRPGCRPRAGFKLLAGSGARPAGRCSSALVTTQRLLTHSGPVPRPQAASLASCSRLPRKHSTTGSAWLCGLRVAPGHGAGRMKAVRGIPGQQRQRAIAGARPERCDC